MPIEVKFAHYECKVSRQDIKELLFTYQGLAHYKNKVFNSLTFHRKPGYLKKKFRDRHIKIANYALSESVYVDPLNDFEENQKWINGQYKFPFYGKYRPLGIVKNEDKRASTQILGTIGEIISGIFFENELQRRIIVRPIYKYPDFIGWNKHYGWSYSESKCHSYESVKNQLNDKFLNKKVPETEVKDLFAQKLPELIANEELTIFFHFSLVNKFKPSIIDHTVIEVFTDKRTNKPKNIPDALGKEILDDAYCEAIKSVYEELRDKEMTDEHKEIKEYFLKREIEEKIKDIEERANIVGVISSTKEIKKKIEEVMETNEKEINDVFNGKKYGDTLNFSSDNIKRMTMTKIKEFDNRNDMYSQTLDSKNISLLDMSTKKNQIYKLNKNEFYVFGNSVLGISPKGKKPNLISMQDKAWKEL